MLVSGADDGCFLFLEGDSRSPYRLPSQCYVVDTRESEAKGLLVNYAMISEDEYSSYLVP